MTDVSVIILLVVSKAMEPTSCKLYLRAPITIEPQTHMELCCSMKNNSWNPFVIIIALFLLQAGLHHQIIDCAQSKHLSFLSFHLNV